MNRKFDLEDRLIDFVVIVLDAVTRLPNTTAGRHIGSQLVRSGTSPAPNYGEAISAESKRDFVHKLKIALKELRETYVWLRIIERKAMIPVDVNRNIATECNEPISILVASTKTAESRN